MILNTVTGVSPHAAQVSKVAATSTAPHTVKDTQRPNQTIKIKETIATPKQPELWIAGGGLTIDM